jgi:hypothetical protein
MKSHGMYERGTAEGSHLWTSSATRRYWTLLDATRRYSTLLDATRRYSTLQDATHVSHLGYIINDFIIIVVKFIFGLPNITKGPIMW